MHAMMSKKSQEGSDQPMVTLDNLVYAGLHVKPSALKEIQLEVPQVRDIHTFLKLSLYTLFLL